LVSGGGLGGFGGRFRVGGDEGGLGGGVGAGGAAGEGDGEEGDEWCVVLNSSGGSNGAVYGAARGRAVIGRVVGTWSFCRGMTR